MKKSMKTLPFFFFLRMISQGYCRPLETSQDLKAKLENNSPFPITLNQIPCHQSLLSLNCRAMNNEERMKVNFYLVNYYVLDCL